MVRVTRGNVACKKRKKVLRRTKGFRGAHSRVYTTANAQAMKKLLYQYIGRKQRKRDFRSLWISRIGAEARKESMTYSQFITLKKQASISLNLKMLSQLLLLENTAFTEIVRLIRKLPE